MDLGNVGRITSLRRPGYRCGQLVKGVRLDFNQILRVFLIEFRGDGLRDVRPA
jgi:hypothetical protein